MRSLATWLLAARLPVPRLVVTWPLVPRSLVALLPVTRLIVALLPVTRPLVPRLPVIRPPATGPSATRPLAALAGLAAPGCRGKNRADGCSLPAAASC